MPLNNENGASNISSYSFLIEKISISIKIGLSAKTFVSVEEKGLKCFHDLA